MCERKFRKTKTFTQRCLNQLELANPVNKCQNVGTPENQHSPGNSANVTFLGMVKST